MADPQRAPTLPTSRSRVEIDFAAIASQLAQDDDPVLWRVVAETLLHQVDTHWTDAGEGVRSISVGFFKVSSWLRPHQTQWTQGGGFADPSSYKWHTDQNADWGVWLRRTRSAGDWKHVDGREPLRRKRGHFALRLSVPARSARHHKAAIAGEWLPRSPWRARASTECHRLLLGLHKSPDGWHTVAQWTQRPNAR